MNFRVTVWEHRGASASFSGRGVFVDMPIAEFAQAMIDEAALTVEKGAGRCFAFAKTDRLGSNDDEVTAITGMLLDSDRPEDFEKVAELEASLRRLGIAYVCTRRGKKAHLLIPYAADVAPPHDKPGEKAHKVARVRVIESLGADHGIAFDVSPGKRYAGLIYTHSRLPGSDAVPVVTWQDGAGLDFAALLECLGEAPAPAAPVSGGAGDFFAAARANAAAPRGPDPDAFTPLSPGDTIGAIKSRAQRQNTNNPDMQKRVRLFLAGKSWASPKEQRDTIAQALTTWLALYTDGKGEIEAIMEVAGPSLDAMVAEQASGFGDGIEEKFLQKLYRNMSQVRHNAAKQAAQLQGIANALTGRR